LDDIAWCGAFTLLPGTSRLFIANFSKMIGHSPPLDVECSGDDSDGPEPEDRDCKTEKFKNLSDTQLDDDIDKYEGYVSTGNQIFQCKLPDDGAKFIKHLQNLKNERESRRVKRSLAVRGVFSGCPNV